VESLTAVVENHDGSFEVINYETFCRRTNREPKGEVPAAVAPKARTPAVESSANPM
jgi:hypothetical protein